MGDQDGSGRVFTQENVQEGSGEIAWNGNIRTNSHTPEIGSPAIDQRPARPPLTGCVRRHLTSTLYPLLARGGIGVYTRSVVVVEDCIGGPT